MYFKVRYLYIVWACVDGMQNAVSVRMVLPTKSTAQQLACYVCGRGLDDGVSVTAKALRNGTVLFCDMHHKMQK